MTQALSMTLGRYQIDERLAIGGMAELFKARVVGAHGFQKSVVIKRILPQLAADPTFVAMFIDEAHITARLDHPKIAQILELDVIDRQLFIAMEFVDGCDLRAVLNAGSRKGSRMPPPIAAHICHEVLDALGYAHGLTNEQGAPLGVIHRDISPSNVLLSWRGDVKLTDFGIARAMESPRQTQAGVIKGKYHYLSPEQVNCDPHLDGRSDIFAVGILLAELLTGRRLFWAKNELDILIMVRDARIERFDYYGTDLDPGLRAIVHCALAKDPRARYQNAAEFRGALADWLFANRHRLGPPELATWLREVFHGARHDVSGPMHVGVGEGASHAGESGTSPAPPPIEDLTPVDDVLPRRRAPNTDFDIDLDSAASAVAASASSPEAEAEIGTGLEQIDEIEEIFDIAPDPPSFPVRDRAGESTGAFAAIQESGDLSLTSAVSLLHRLTVDGATAHVVFDSAAGTRSVYMVDGRIDEVRSSVEAEALDAALVRVKMITDLERSFVLAMLPRFGGNMPDTIVGLGLLGRPALVDLVTRHSRGLLLEILGTRSGSYRIVAGGHNGAQSFPIEINTMEIIGAAARVVPESLLLPWVRSVVERRLLPRPGASGAVNAFGFGKAAGYIFSRLDGSATVRDHLIKHTEPAERRRFLQWLYLMVDVGLVLLD